MARRRTSVPLIGRQAELDALVAVLESAAVGAAGVALVGGEAGVGKSRVVAELVARARARGSIVLLGQCAELGESVPYLPLADALRDATRGERADPAVVEAVGRREVLGRLLPDAHNAGSTPDLAQQRLFGAVLGVLAELAESRPVLLVLEDLHWADRSTRDLVTFLSRVLRHERVAVVCTYRTDDMHRRHPLRPTVAELHRLPGVTVVDLAPLDPLTIEALVGALAPELTATEVEEIAARAEGNAFYAEELTAAVGTGERLPLGLAGLLLARIDQLAEPAQRVLRVAAVARSRVDDRLLHQLCGLDDTVYPAAVREAVAHQLLVPDEDQGYSFRHALMAEAVYADLLPTERARTHAAFAAELGATGDAGRRSGTSAELAYHCLASHDVPGALTASLRAARDAERLAAPAEARRHYEQALELWDRVDDAAALTGTDRAEVALSCAEATAASGDTHRATAQLSRMRDALAGSSDHELVSRVNERLAYHLPAKKKGARAVEAALAAVEAMPADPPTAQRARALSTYARALLHRDGERARDLAGQALHAARAVRAPDVEAQALVTLGLSHEISGDVAGAGEFFSAACGVAGACDNLTVYLRAASHHARAQYERGELQAAGESATEAVVRAGEAGLTWSDYAIDLRFLQVLILYTRGDWAAARRLGSAFTPRAGTDNAARLSSVALFVEVAQGDAAAVDERLAWLARVWTPYSAFITYVPRGLAAEHALWQGRPEAAIEHVTAVLEGQERRGPHESPAMRIAATGMWAWADTAEDARRHGDEVAERAAVRAAGQLLELAERAARRCASLRLPFGIEARAWQARILAEWSRARGVADLEAWRAAVHAFDYGFDYEVARSRWHLAEALAQHGRRDEARVQAAEAAAVARRLGAVPLCRALDDLVRRARLAPAGDPGRAPAGLTGLTPREVEVLRLLAQGRSNREIAASLFISPKTASVHVSNILAKLSVSGRTEAAAVAHREGLLAG